MKSGRITKLLVICVLVIICAISGLWVFNSTVNNPLKISNAEMVEVKEGDSFNNIIKKLSEQGKVKSPFLIKIYTKISGINLEVIPGMYELTSDMSVLEITETLREPTNLNTIILTIPEGFNIEDIAARVEEKGLATADEFLNAVKQYPLPSYVKNISDKRYNLEGFLFPDTYNFENGVSPEYIIESMLNRFEEIFKEISANSTIQESDIERIVTIASMIEKEARTDEDRPLISSVIKNRLEVDMPLQICATVIYAHGYYIEDVRNRHLAIESKYNTYLYKGLPVGPISNPGVPSLIAAMNPADTDYLFYLLAGEDEHFFTNNYDDFLNKKTELGY